MSKRKAIVLLSGGLDSTTTLHYALGKGYQCYALIVNYDQRHKREIKHAVSVAKKAKVSYKIIKITLPWKGSSLLDNKVQLPTARSLETIGKEIPSTYVPARNTIFLSLALSYAEAIGAEAIFIGANAIDYSGYPDCRPDYYQAFKKVVQKGTKAKTIKIITPLINMTKAEIVLLGRKLGAPIDSTWSCYEGGVDPCEVCDSCVLRKQGFAKAGES